MNIAFPVGRAFACRRDLRFKPQAEQHLLRNNGSQSRARLFVAQMHRDKGGTFLAQFLNNDGQCHVVALSKLLSRPRCWRCLVLADCFFPYQAWVSHRKAFLGVLLTSASFWSDGESGNDRSLMVIVARVRFRVDDRFRGTWQ